MSVLQSKQDKTQKGNIKKNTEKGHMQLVFPRLCNISFGQCPTQNVVYGSDSLKILVLFFESEKSWNPSKDHFYGGTVSYVYSCTLKLLNVENISMLKVGIFSLLR